MNKFTILISDRNKNVRHYLRREFTAEGYSILLAKNAKELLEWVYRHHPVDLIILDPELPGAEEASLLEKISDKVPNIPVVVHTYSPVCDPQPYSTGNINFVEKEGSSIEHLKKKVFYHLHKASAFHG